MDKFHDLVEETKAMVREQITNGDSRPDHVLERQLYSILNELEKMDQIRNRDLFFPYYPKGIVDGWDLSDPFANRLMEVLEEYCKL